MDNAGNASEHGQSFNVSAPGDETGPYVQIHRPSMGDSPTAPQEVVATVQDPNLGEWILEVGQSDSECFTPIASGRGELVEELAGHLDTTLMPNGMYDLRLTAYDANQQGTRDTVTLFIQGEFKVGRFTTGFRDLEIPLRGIPIQVNRFYDSTDKCPGDFGYGWNLAEPDIRANITPGPQATEPGSRDITTRYQRARPRFRRLPAQPPPSEG